MINIAELITDPDFCQPNGISITRTTTEIQNHQIVETIITIADETSDELLETADLVKERIHVFTHERLKVVGTDKVDGKSYGSDIVHFNGANYIVRYCLDDSQYGFCRSTAVKMEAEVM